MTFQIDPRICLKTGEDIAGFDHHGCCTGDHYVTHETTGLSGAFKEKMAKSKFLAKSTVSDGVRSFFNQPGNIQSGLSDSVRGGLAASTPKQQKLPLYARQSRREDFVNMLRRMFRRAPL